jgi:NADH:ubiquinone reductase (H+-translocating)
MRAESLCASGERRRCETGDSAGAISPAESYVRAMTYDTLTHRVVVVGGGFGGIEAVKRLARAPVIVTLVDRRNFHLFQPLTYQVATGALTPGEIAYPLRALFKRARNVRVLMAEVTGFDVHRRRVLLAGASPISYDTLVVAAGSAYSYFGHDGWGRTAPEVKSLESALAIRARILAAFERAEMASDREARGDELSFIVVGGGPTGVEMAGQIGELARDTLRRDFRAIASDAARIFLVEAGQRLLPSFPPSLSAKAERSLRQLGVTTLVQSTVTAVDQDGVVIQAPDGQTTRLSARTAGLGCRGEGLAARRPPRASGRHRRGRVGTRGRGGRPNPEGPSRGHRAR